MKANIIETSYRLMVMLGEIHNEMERGGTPATLDEIAELYGYASELHEHIVKQVKKAVSRRVAL